MTASRGLAIVVVAVAVALAGCQPADEPDLSPPQATEAAVSATSAPGAPAVAVPTGVEELRRLAEPVAVDWQAAPQLVELVVELDDGTPDRAVLTYVAADADRMLVLAVGGSAIAEQQPTLEGLDLGPLPRRAIEDIPELPAAALDPADLARAAGPDLDGCGHGERARRIRYTTPAPEAWDGARWTAELSWSAAAIGDGGGVIVDPVDGEAADDACFDL